MLSFVLLGVQLAVTVVIGIYFFIQLRQQPKQLPGTRREGSREMDRLQCMRAVHLSEPLSERVRPARFEDIVGQEEGIRSLKAILCGRTKFTSTEVIEEFGLSSSANVRRLKDALAKKEIVDFENQAAPRVIDPLFEYWVRTRYFGMKI